MRRLRLEGPGSYQGFGVAVTRKSPEVVVDDGVAEALLRSGCFRDYGPVKAAEEEVAVEREGEPAEEEAGSPAPQGEAPKRKKGGK